MNSLQGVFYARKAAQYVKYAGDCAVSFSKPDVT
ncbi:hypothetical protein EABG_00054 [Escherichia coli H223]|nr:hypothetical protein EAIG_04893 [Escherichia coli B108]OSK75989.1 hypothetical protein EABG_00054 [Escherichia coli H223]OSK80378.1 hypothetical protein ECZG_05188 [Escherichia coli H378]